MAQWQMRAHLLRYDMLVCDTCERVHSPHCADCAACEAFEIEPDAVTLGQALDLIESGASETPVDVKTLRALVEDVRRTLFGLRVNPDAPIRSAT